MGNMSYCRFRNTLADLQDCYDALNENGIDELSDEEKRAAIKLINICCDIKEEFEQELTK